MHVNVEFDTCPYPDKPGAIFSPYECHENSKTNNVQLPNLACDTNPNPSYCRPKSLKICHKYVVLFEKKGAKSFLKQLGIVVFSKC